MGCPTRRPRRRIRRFRPSGSAGRLSRGRSGAGGIPWDEGGEAGLVGVRSRSCGFGSVGVLPRRVGSGLKPCEGRTVSFLGPPPLPGVWVTSMNPHSLEGTMMVPTTSLLSPLLLPRTHRTLLPDSVPPGHCSGSRAQPAPADRRPGIGCTGREGPPPLPSGGCDPRPVHGRGRPPPLRWACGRRRGLGPGSSALCPPGAPRSAGVPGDRLRSRPLPPLRGAQRHGSGAGVLRAIAAACGRHSLAVVDHLVVTATGGYSSGRFAGR